MITFGQRLKILRKEASLTQGDLAEQLMVAVQTVSKWECDTSMPDISQLIPLSAILGVTTDCLLGVGGNEKEDREKLLEQINDLENHYNCQNYENNADYMAYELYREYTKKYPLDYWGKYHCSQFIFDFLINGRFGKKYTVPEDEEKSLLDEGMKLLQTIISQDKDPERQIHAKILLTKYHIYKDEYTKAETVAMEIPDIFDLRKGQLLNIYDFKGDYEKCLSIAEDISVSYGYAIFDSLYSRARRISIFGNERKQEAIEAWRFLEEVSRAIYKQYRDVYRFEAVLIAISSRSNDHIAIAEFDNSIKAVEEIRDFSIEHYNYVKENGGTNNDLENIKAIAQRMFKRCYTCTLGEPDNVIDRDPRFRKCQEDIEALN